MPYNNLKTRTEQSHLGEFLSLNLHNNLTGSVFAIFDAHQFTVDIMTVVRLLTKKSSF